MSNSYPASLCGLGSSCSSLTKPSFRRGCSGLSIEDGEFEWLKGYLIREHSKQGLLSKDADASADDLEDSSAPTAEPEEPTRKSKTLRSEPTEEAAPSLVWSASLVLDPSDEESTPSPENMMSMARNKRRKIGWTNTEDLTILAAARRIGTQWHRIAAHLPGRTSDAVRNRWHRLQKMHCLGDSEEGRAAIDTLLITSGVDPDWVPPEIETPTPAAPAVNQKDECTFIRGSDHGRSMWTAEEDAIIESGVAKFGCKWRQIASLLTNRSDSSVRNRWMRLCKERQVMREVTGPVLTPVSMNAHESEVECPRPMLFKTKSKEIGTTSDLDGDLAKAVHDLDVDELPLGMEAPELLLDLDKFVEAVEGVLHDDGAASDDLLHCDLDPHSTTRSTNSLAFFKEKRSE